MARRLQTWGIAHFCVDANGKNGQHHVIVVAESRRRAAELINTTDYQMKGWAMQPGVNDEIGEILKACGEGAWIVTGDASQRILHDNIWPARLVGNQLRVVED